MKRRTPQKESIHIGISYYSVKNVGLEVEAKSGALIWRAVGLPWEGAWCGSQRRNEMGTNARRERESAQEKDGN